VILTVQSTLHGARTWTRVGTREHTTRDGRHVILAEWEGDCTICGKPFRVLTPGNVSTVEQSKSFQMVTCAEHRLTASAVSKLRFAKAADRPAVFESLKRDITACS
jgi:hypothetical protein